MQLERTQRARYAAGKDTACISGSAKRRRIDSTMPPLSRPHAARIAAGSPWSMKAIGEPEVKTRHRDAARGKRFATALPAPPVDRRSPRPSRTSS